METPAAKLSELRGSCSPFRNRKIYVRSNAKFFQKNRSLDSFVVTEEHKKSQTVALTVGGVEAGPQVWLGTRTTRLYRQVISYDYSLTFAPLEF